MFCDSQLDGVIILLAYADDTCLLLSDTYLYTKAHTGLSQIIDKLNTKKKKNNIKLW